MIGTIFAKIVPLGVFIIWAFINYYLTFFSYDRDWLKQPVYIYRVRTIFRLLIRTSVSPFEGNCHLPFCSRGSWPAEQLVHLIQINYIGKIEPYTTGVGVKLGASWYCFKTGSRKEISSHIPSLFLRVFNYFRISSWNNIFVKTKSSQFCIICRWQTIFFMSFFTKEPPLGPLFYKFNCFCPLKLFRGGKKSSTFVILFE